MSQKWNHMIIAVNIHKLWSETRFVSIVLDIIRLIYMCNFGLKLGVCQKKKNKCEVSSSLERPMHKDLWLIHKALLKLNGFAWMGQTRTGNWNINGFYWSHKPNSCNKKLTSFSSHEKSESEDARLSHCLNGQCHKRDEWIGWPLRVRIAQVHIALRSNRTHAPLSSP